MGYIHCHGGVLLSDASGGDFLAVGTVDQRGLLAETLERSYHAALALLGYGCGVSGWGVGFLKGFIVGWWLLGDVFGVVRSLGSGCLWHW